MTGTSNRGSERSLRLYAATGERVLCLEGRGESWQVVSSTASTGAFALAADPADGSVIYAGLHGGGVRRSDDAGFSWVDCSPPETDVFSVAVSAADGAVYAGVEPSRLYRSEDRGESWRALDGLLKLPSRPSWSFPPRPWTSHVRAIAPSPHDPDTILVGIELGGLMRSTDGGETWQDHRRGAQRDVHSLAWHPQRRGWAFEAGGGGAAWSEDWGESWQAADEGRDRRYTWALAIDHDDPDVWYLSASTGARAAHGPGAAEAHIYRRRGEEPWRALAGGLTAPLEAMPYALASAQGCVLAGLADGELWCSEDGGERWRKCEVEGEPPSAVHDLALVEP